MKNKKHPLGNFTLNVKNIKCFGESGSGKFEFAPITFVIGKNNSGKSSVLDVIENMCVMTANQDFRNIARSHETPSIEISTLVDAGKLQAQFPPNLKSSQIPGGNDWEYAQRFIDKRLTWSLKNGDSVRLVQEDLDLRDQNPVARERLDHCFVHPLKGNWSLRIRAERNVVPEASDRSRTILGTGEGLTNLIRAFINSDDLPRHVVESDLLDDLNSIYLGDSEFTGILCQENEETGLWEIYLREEGKGDIRLSQSGSSLKTAFVVTAFLRLLPMVSEKGDMSKLIFCVEEPENNLHPSLLRRLIDFLANKRNNSNFSLVVTTHSPICIDWAAKQTDSTILHVRNEAGYAVCENVEDYGGRVSILDDLDVRGSDILQANGVIWVEGPSDRIYLNKWIELASDGKIREGANYSFLYYGGKVLSHFEAMPADEISNKIKMLLINRNVAVVMDSDRRLSAGKGGKPRMHLNATKRRLRDEVLNCGGFAWVTLGKEIENYVPKICWENLVGKEIDIKNEYVDIPSIGTLKSSFKTKVDLAHEVTPHIRETHFTNHLDLDAQVNSLCSHIRRWNGL